MQILILQMVTPDMFSGEIGVSFSQLLKVSYMARALIIKLGFTALDFLCRPDCLHSLNNIHRALGSGASNLLESSPNCLRYAHN